MSQERSNRSVPGPENGVVFLVGVVTVLASIAAAVWSFSVGDTVTAVGLGLVVLAGALVATIGFSRPATF